MDTAITVALIGAGATIVNAVMQRAKEAKKGKDTSATGSLPGAAKPPTPRPKLVFVSMLAAGFSITALIITLLWVRSLPAPIQIESGLVEIKASPTEIPVHFKRSFPSTPVVSVQFTGLNQGVDEKRNFSFEAAAKNVTKEGFTLSAKYSYPGGVGKVSWIAFAQ
jgi:hypothetical protein